MVDYGSFFLFLAHLSALFCSLLLFVTLFCSFWLIFLSFWFIFLFFFPLPGSFLPLNIFFLLIFALSGFFFVCFLFAFVFAQFCIFVLISALVCSIWLFVARWFFFAENGLFCCLYGNKCKYTQLYEKCAFPGRKLSVACLWPSHWMTLL